MPYTHPVIYQHCLSLLIVSLAIILTIAAPAAEPTKVVRMIDVAPVWSGHPVDFALLTTDEHQFVGYYDAQRHMTIAQRRIGETEWTYHRLRRVTGWDSHNYIAMAVDRDNHLHVSGDMHVNPLYYLRTTRPLDVTSLRQVEHMVGPKHEQRVTYPRFINGPNGELIFRYRDGSSGRGDDYYNVYDPDTRQWRRLLDQPLITGGGQKNAYATAPTPGPDGNFHITWVWRQTPDAATNHHLSYARSPDLLHWTTAGGEPLTLPITFQNCEVVDPVPPGGGMINGNTMLGFDHHNRVIITYHKYDDEGNTQIYNARFENNQWQIHQTSDWDYRWEFGGGGTIPFEVRVGRVRPLGPSELALSYCYPKGSGRWVLNEKTLTPIPGRTTPPENAPLPHSLSQLHSDFPGMSIRRTTDQGTAPEPRTRYLLTWETLGRNRDRPRQPPLPEPSMLRLIKLQDPAEQ